MTATEKFKQKMLWLLDDSPGWLRLVIALVFVLGVTFIIGAAVGQFWAVLVFVGVVSGTVVGIGLFAFLVAWIIVGFE